MLFVCCTQACLREQYYHHVLEAQRTLGVRYRFHESTPYTILYLRGQEPRGKSEDGALRFILYEDVGIHRGRTFYALLPCPHKSVPRWMEKLLLQTKQEVPA